MNKFIAIMGIAAVIIIAANCMVRTSTEADRTKAYGFAQASMTMASAQAQAQMTMAAAESTKASAEASATRSIASAEASATRTAAITPILVMFGVVIGGILLLLVPVVIVVLFRYSLPAHQHQEPIRIIEQRTIVLLPAPDMSRREFYRAIGGNVEVRRLGGGS